MATPPYRGLPKLAPEKGSFPLDHFAECKAAAQAYMACMEEHDQESLRCRDEAKIYLQCRMDKNLMADENLSQLGFSDKKSERLPTLKEIQTKSSASPASVPDEELIAGIRVHRNTPWRRGGK